MKAFDAEGGTHESQCGNHRHLPEEDANVTHKLWMMIVAALALLGAAVLWLGFKVLILWLTRD